MQTLYYMNEIQNFVVVFCCCHQTNKKKYEKPLNEIDDNGLTNSIWRLLHPLIPLQILIHISVEKV